MAADDPAEVEELAAERHPRPAAPPPARRATGLAWAVALAADGLQIIAFPLFFAGAASPWDDVADLVVGATLVRLLGWHWAFLPALIAELVPGLDLVPTWTAAVWIATRGRPRA